ncbi:MAG: hypothetical protein QF918_03010 [Pirellulaceae bacterium]|jgi:hypothetical protein|nr:hypothetical protein [Pirellulaceae bacterium]MDP6553447.1 hypothetical protein [Pirellulaceae bacterium]MDP6723079.1 hypothetical protein [Pirellulaceae bacterium]
MNDQSAWRLCGATVQLTTESLEATIDVERPDLGLGSLTSCINGHKVKLDAAGILGVCAGQVDPAAVKSTDYYVRGDDMIVSYQLATTPDVGLQIYWRVIHDETTPATGIEAIVSAQTELSDSHPALTVRSLLPPGDVLTMTASGDRTFRPLALDRDDSATSDGAVLIRFDSDEISFLEMVHPSDDCGVTIKRTSGQLVTYYPILTEQLEKGVIRRSRIRGMFLPRENDSSFASELYAQFASSPTPLTT